ncbi:MAG: ABC transporter permease [Acetobacteraceae bacterium]|nr:ABC transporter permease [Acetobacteraceae bacterium]
MGTPRRRLSAALPALAAAGAIALPVLGGLVGTLLPAFGVLPAIGAEAPSLEQWRRLFAEPGIERAALLSLSTGLAATALSLLSVALFCAAAHGSRGFARVQALALPVLATPHAALAIGLLFLIAPSGLLLRLLSPWATGFDLPPDIATVNDGLGLALLLGLVVKETPYLLLMTLAALNQVPAAQLLAVATSLGQPRPVAWLKAVFPLVYRQIRLPVFAVLAYSVGTVDVALILGPSAPPTLAPLLLRWATSPDLSLLLPASAGALLLLGVALAAAGVWIAGERAAATVGRAWAAGGRGIGAAAIRAGAALLPLSLLLAYCALAAVALWSVAGPWRFPDALPERLQGGTWAAQAPALAGPAVNSLVVALVATGIALVLAVAALEARARHGPAALPWLLRLSALPLLLPQAGFLLGLQAALLALGLEGGVAAVALAHLVFVMPYVLLSLSDAYAALDPRLPRVAACLGASPARVFLAVKLPLLLRPLLVAAAVGIAVSIAQYLPTLLAGGGRLATLTTEAVTLAAGGDRRVLGVVAVAQAAIPLLAFAAALLLPAAVWRRRAGLRA